MAENRDPFKPKKKLKYSEGQKKRYKRLSSGVFDRKDDEDDKKSKEGRLQKLKKQLGW